MKALVLEAHGQFDKIVFKDVQDPEIASNEVLLKVKAAALNRLDLWILNGWPGLKLQFPHILGCDSAGEIIACGESVSRFSVGDRVVINPTRSCGKCTYCLSGRDNMCDHFAIFGEHVPGFYCEYQSVPARNLLKLPDEISFETGAAASLVYVTAWHSLISKGKFQPGEDILVIGAGGGVNTAYIDIARLAGAGKIYVVGSNQEKLDVAKRLGADVAINRNEEDWSRAIYKATDRQGVDIVVDNVGAPTYQSSIRSLKKGGRLLTVGNSIGPKFEIDNRYIFSKHLKIIGSTMGPILDYEKVMDQIFRGKLTPIIDSVYPLENGLSALKRLKKGDITGKLVLNVA